MQKRLSGGISSMKKSAKSVKKLSLVFNSPSKTTATDKQDVDDTLAVVNMPKDHDEIITVHPGIIIINFKCTHHSFQPLNNSEIGSGGPSHIKAVRNKTFSDYNLKKVKLQYYTADL